MKKPQQTGVIVQQRPTDADKEPKDDEGDDSGLEACAEDLIRAIHSKDVKAVKAALKATFEICDSMPHSEGEDISPHSYDAQNQKAGQE